MGNYIVSKSKNEFMEKLNYFLNIYFNECNEDNEILENNLSNYYELDKKL